VPESQGALPHLQGSGVPATPAARKGKVRRRLSRQVRLLSLRHYATGFIAALKIINKLDLLCDTAEENQKALNQLLREIKIQSFLNHPNLVKIYDFFSDEQSVYLLLELACDGHLFDFLQRSQGLTEESTSIIVR
jgi:serine/threonine protein kinase